MIKETFQKLLRGERIPEEEQLRLLQWVEQAETITTKNFIYETITSSIRQLFPRVSDMTNQLGLHIAGEFRSGNGRAPGDGFTGGRYGYPGFTYGGTEYFLAGVSNDVLQVGLALLTGKVVAGAGDITMDADGVWVTNQQAAFGFEDTSGNRFTIYLFSDGSNHLWLKNEIPGAEIVQAVTLTDETIIELEWGEHPTSDNQARFHIPPGSAGGRAEFGNDHFIDYLKSDGTGSATVYFNERGKDIDFSIKDATDAEIFRTDAGAGTVTIAGIASGTYTPTITGVANVDSASASGDFLYNRIGNIVTVAGTMNVDPTTITTVTDVGISLPIASNFSAATDCAGTGGAQGNDDVASVIGDATNDRAVLRFTANGTANAAFRVNFMYKII